MQRTTVEYSSIGSDAHQAVSAGEGLLGGYGRYLVAWDYIGVTVRSIDDDGTVVYKDAYATQVAMMNGYFATTAIGDATQVTVVDLRGTAPASFAVPAPSGVRKFAAAADAFAIANDSGVLSSVTRQNAVLATRRITCGAATALAASDSGTIAVASAGAGVILAQAAPSGAVTILGTLPEFGERVALSADGVHVAIDNAPDSVSNPVRVNVYETATGLLVGHWEGARLVGFVREAGRNLVAMELGGDLVYRSPDGGESRVVLSPSEQRMLPSPGGANLLSFGPGPVPPDGTTRVFVGSQLRGAVVGDPQGWIDEGRYLVTSYVAAGAGGVLRIPNGTRIFGLMGELLAALPSAPSLLRTWRRGPTFSVLDASHIVYGRSVLDLANGGATSWSTSYPVVRSQAVGRAVVYTTPDARVLIETPN